MTGCRRGVISHVTEGGPPPRMSSVTSLMTPTISRSHWARYARREEMIVTSNPRRVALDPSAAAFVAAAESRRDGIGEQSPEARRAEFSTLQYGIPDVSTPGSEIT